MLDDRCQRFLLALVPCPASVDELEPVGRHPAGGAGPAASNCLARLQVSQPHKTVQRIFELLVVVVAETISAIDSEPE